MNTYYFNTKDIGEYIGKLSCGDRVYLSGEIYTARDAAHKRFFELLEDNRPLPFQIKNSVIYYNTDKS
ncbi:MAG: fumarate hydratase C-terminal domain-containing protein [Clostridia bacterium]|nr:fumarate hydratase C-terminal domain-containing protein [Clostridia bacterium]